MKVTFVLGIWFAIITNAKLETFSNQIFFEIAHTNKNKNIIVSPASIRSCLGLVYMAAEGRTAFELKNALQLKGETKNEVGMEFKAYMKKIKESHIQLKAANRLYISEEYLLAEDYEYRLRKYFNSQAEKVNFTDPKTIKNINAWVEAQTNHHIKKILNDEISKDDFAILISAIYFKANWKIQFENANVKKTDFYMSEEHSVPVDMMFLKEEFNYTHLKELDAFAIEIPYNKTDLRMLVLLPKHLNGLTDMEKKLVNFDLTSIKFETETLELSMPKFKIEFGTRLQAALKKLGVKLIFKEGDFSGMLKDNKDIHISDIIHKAYIEVDTKGTKAAAATAIKLTRFNTKFDINHPFFFAIKDDETIYFTGHVTHF